MFSSHSQADEHVLFHSWAQGFVISQLFINTHLKVLNMYIFVTVTYLYPLCCSNVKSVLCLKME